MKPSFEALEARRHGEEVSDAEMGIINNTGDWNSPGLLDSDQSETSSVVTWPALHQSQPSSRLSDRDNCRLSSFSRHFPSSQQAAAAPPAPSNNNLMVGNFKLYLWSVKIFWQEPRSYVLVWPARGHTVNLIRFKRFFWCLLWHFEVVNIYFNYSIVN